MATGRLLPLDLLRGLAVMLVIGRHVQLPAQADPFTVLAIGWWVHSGWIGVDLFFVLSGFLVSGLIFREVLRSGSFDLWRFFLRRGLRIYPAFYTFLILTLPLVQISQGAVNWVAFVCEAVFIQNYGPNLWSHTWSLAIEEHFYIFLGLLLFSLTRRGKTLKAVPWVCLVFLVVPLVLRMWTATQTGLDDKARLSVTHLRCDALAFGVLISYFYNFHRQSLERWIKPNAWLVVIGLMCIGHCAIGYTYGWFNYTFGLTLLYVGWGAVLIRCLYWDGGKLIRPAAWLAAVGVYSYSIYLWHVPVNHVVYFFMESWTAVKLSFALKTVVYVALSVAVGVLASIAVEIPVLNMRDRWLPPPARPVGDDSAAA